MLLAALAGDAQAAPGGLDPSFGTAGQGSYALYDKHGQFQEAAPYVLAQTAGGKILIAGNVSPPPGGDWHVFATLLGETGALDPSYGTGGTVQTSVPPGLEPDDGPTDSTAAGGVLEANGALMLAGKTSKFRLTPTGAYDTTYQGERTPLEVFAVSALPGGETVLAGDLVVEAAETPPPAVQRLLASGAPDAGYGPEGVKALAREVDGRALDRIESSALLPDGDLLVAGNDRVQEGEGLSWLAAITPAGALDMSFGTGGYAFVPGSGTRLGVEPSGTIIIADALARSESERSQVTVRALQPNGTVDPAFGREGATTIPLRVAGLGNRAAAITVDPAGNVYVGVNEIVSTTLPETGHGYIARITPSGGLDPSFGIAGLTPLASEAEIYSLAIDPKGRLLVAGQLLPPGQEGQLNVERILTGAPTTGPPTTVPTGARTPAVPSKSLRCSRVRHGKHRRHDLCTLLLEHITGHWQTIEVKIRPSWKHRPFRLLRTPLHLPLRRSFYVAARHGKVICTILLRDGHRSKRLSLTAATS